MLYITILALTFAHCINARNHGGRSRSIHQDLSRRVDLESPSHGTDDVLVQIKPVESGTAGTSGTRTGTGSAQWLTYDSVPTSAVNLAATGGGISQDAKSGVEGAPSITQQHTSVAASTSATADRSGPGPVSQDQADRWVKAHNDARAAHGAGRVTWNKDLAEGAKTNAIRCTKGHTSKGENIATSTAEMTPESAVDQWMANANLWNGDYEEQTAHFSQVVWKESLEIGCFIQTCQPGTRYGAEYGNSWVATCRYDPWGNNVATMKNNVE